MRTLRIPSTALLALGLVACSDDPVGREPAVTAGAASADAADLSRGGESDGGGQTILLLDDCDPRDPTWAPVGCFQRTGRVTNLEFMTLARSPLSAAIVGHPAWRNEPSYLDIKHGTHVNVTNAGGRPHSLTEVANFGGGRVPPLNQGLAQAPECLVTPSTTDVLPGASMRIENLGVGIHRFQCCFHPWMRELIAVSARDGEG